MELRHKERKLQPSIQGTIVINLQNRVRRMEMTESIDDKTAGVYLETIQQLSSTF